MLRRDEHTVIGRLRVGRAGPDHDASLHPGAWRGALRDNPRTDRPVTVRRIGRGLRKLLRDEPEVVIHRPDVRPARLDVPGAGGSAGLLRGKVDLVAWQDVHAD